MMKVFLDFITHSIEIIIISLGKKKYKRVLASQVVT